jgi:hypothetical protein
VRVLLLLIASCQLYPSPAHARVMHGPAYGTPLTTLVALPAEPAMCEPAQCRAVDGVARLTLEYYGYTLVDAERVNAELRQRTVTNDNAYVEGRTWRDATPDEQRALATDIGADGVLETAVMTSPGSHSYTRTYTVSLTVRALDGRIAWHSECADEAGDHKLERQALESAARCALDSAVLW